MRPRGLSRRRAASPHGYNCHGCTYLLWPYLLWLCLLWQESIFLHGSLLENLFAFYEGAGKGSNVEVEAAAEAEAEAEAEAWRVLELVGLRGRIEGLPERLHTDVVAADLSEVSKDVQSRWCMFTCELSDLFTPLHLLTNSFTDQG